MNDLIDIASQNGIFHTKNLDKYCYNINQYRNNIHMRLFQKYRLAVFFNLSLKSDANI
jgi:hypothetical protein